MAINFDKAQLLKEALSILDNGQEKGALTVYNGNPNGNVTATVGALCIDYSGSGKLWKNTDGSTTWVELGTGSSGGSPYFDDDGGTPTTAPSAGATDSIAIGDGATVGASATGSLAFGVGSSVGTGSVHAISIGTGSSIGNTNSVSIAIGVYSQCTNGNNIAIGRYAKALIQPYCIAIGSSGSGTTNSSGNSSIAIGRNANSSNSSSLAIGRETQATGLYSIAIGGASISAATATGSDSIAIGRGSDSTSNGSIAIGRNAQATTNIYSIAIGSGSTTSLAATATGDRSVAIGFGSDATGSCSSAIGRYTQATGLCSIALGGGYSTGATSSGIDTIAIGQSSSASGNRSISIGRNASSASVKSVTIGAGSQNRNTNSIRCVTIGNDVTTGYPSFWSMDAIAIGSYSMAYSSSANIIAPIAIGLSANTSGDKSISIGVLSSASGLSSISIGSYSTNSADNCLAIGVMARGRVAMTSQIQGVSINRKDEAIVSSSDVFRDFASNEAIVMTKEIDLKTLSTTTITVPTGSRFYPNEVGLILTTLGGTITLQPDVSFGITGINNKFVTQTTSSLSAIYDRDVYTSLTTAGESSLTFTVNVAAVCSADMKGRAYFKGMLVEVQ